MDYQLRSLLAAPAVSSRSSSSSSGIGAVAVELSNRHCNPRLCCRKRIQDKPGRFGEIFAWGYLTVTGKTAVVGCVAVGLPASASHGAPVTASVPDAMNQFCCLLR